VPFTDKKVQGLLGKFTKILALNEMSISLKPLILLAIMRFYTFSVNPN